MLREVTEEIKKWKSYDGGLHATPAACQNHERVVAFLNAGDLTVHDLLKWIRDSTFQESQDIGWLGEILYERQQWIRLQKAEELAATSSRSSRSGEGSAD